MKLIERIKRFFYPEYPEEETMIPKNEFSFETPDISDFYIKDDIVYINLELSKKFNSLITDSFYSKNFNVRAISLVDFKAIADKNPDIKFTKKEMPEALKDLVERKVSIDTKSRLLTMKVKESKVEEKEEEPKVIKTTVKEEDSDKVRKIKLEDRKTVTNKKKDFRIEFDDNNKKAYVIYEKSKEKPKKEKIEKVEVITVYEDPLVAARRKIDEANKRYVYEYERRQKAKEDYETEIDRAVDNIVFYKFARELLQDQTKEIVLKTKALSQEKEDLTKEISELQKILSEKQTRLNNFTKPKTKVKK